MTKFLIDPDAGDSEGERDVAGEVRYLGELHARVELEVVSGHCGPAGDVGDPRADAEALQRGAQALAVEFRLFPAVDDGGRRALQQAERRIGVFVALGGEVLLYLARDVLGLGGDLGRGLFLRDGRGGAGHSLRLDHGHASYLRGVLHAERLHILRRGCRRRLALLRRRSLSEHIDRGRVVERDVHVAAAAPGLVLHGGGLRPRRRAHRLGRLLSLRKDRRLDRSSRCRSSTTARSSAFSPR